MTSWHDLRDDLAELAPVVRRSAELDPAGVVRVRVGDGVAAALVRLPFGVLAARTIAIGGQHQEIDVTVGAADLLGWIDRTRDQPPQPRDMDWRGGLPPARGWQRVDAVPDSAVRDVVRAGAVALKDAAAREGVPGAEPRAEVADALLDSIVLTVTSDDGSLRTARITLRVLGAATRMGFVARDSHVNIDVNGRWTRVAGAYGSVYAEAPGGLSLSG